MNVPKIITVYPLGNKKLTVKFDNGIQKIYDRSPLLKHEPFLLLKAEAFFRSVKVDAEGNGIS